MTQLTAASFLKQFPAVKESDDVLNSKYKKMYDQVRAEGFHPTAYRDAQNFMLRMGLCDKTIAVISSHPEPNVRGEAKEYGLHGYISRFVGDAKDKSVEIGKMVARGNHHPDFIAYLGDTVFDIQAAKKAGVVSIGVASGYHTKERLIAENPDLVVESLTELLTHLL